MRTRMWMATLAVAGVCGWFGGGAFSDEKQPAAGGSMTDHKAMEKAMEELARPGDMHKWLAKFNGRWSIRGKFHLPDGTSEDTCGRATFCMAIGGRFSEQRYSGVFGGKRFEGRGFTGYDNLSKQFENFWFDSMGTTPSISRGALSADGKTLDLSGEWTMPGDVKMPFKFVLTWLNARQFTFTMLMDVGGGTMVPMGELTYTRCC